MSLLFPASILRHRRPALPVPLLWLTLGLSLLVHLIALLVHWPDIFPKDQPDSGGLGKALRVQIAQPAAPRAPAAAAVQPPLAPAESAARAAPPLVPRVPRPAPSPPPPVLARQSPQAPAASTAPTAPTAPALTATAPATTEPDMAQMLEARRRARAANTMAQAASTPAPAAPLEDEKSRRDAIVAANMGTIKAPTMGDTQPRGGGMFSLRRVGIYDGEFVFYGWNRDINRQLSQVIEVKIGKHPNMQIAMVRRMIAIIRDHEKEDFTWQSQGHGRIVRLSARQRDTEALEEYLLGEFFDSVRAPR